jgi:hypothetical protein
MYLAGLLAVTLVVVLLGLGAGLVLFARFLTSETDEDQAMRFDPFAAPPPSLWYLPFFHWWRRRPRQLTYRRDARGRFRKPLR